MSMNSGLSPNPNFLKSKLTKGLLRALLRINSQPYHHQQPRLRSPREIQRRHRLIKAAAYGSMASSIGNRRAWSRALLWKIRNQTSRRGRHAAARRRKRRTSTARHQLSYSMMKKRIGEVQKENSNNMRRRRNRVVDVGGDGSGQVDKLRSLVPGGRVMEPCRLLEETAHYMKCLATQEELDSVEEDEINFDVSMMF